MALKELMSQAAFNSHSVYLSFSFQIHFIVFKGACQLSFPIIQLFVGKTLELLSEDGWTWLYFFAKNRFLHLIEANIVSYVN